MLPTVLLVQLLEAEAPAEFTLNQLVQSLVIIIITDVDGCTRLRALLNIISDFEQVADGLAQVQDHGGGT